MENESYAIVRKANDLIQKSRFNLSLQQQKIVLYLISQISPFDDDFKLYEFSIPEFCRICGIFVESGKNYHDLKEAIKEIRDKSIWVTLEDGRETTLAWIEKPYIDPQSGTIQIRLDKDMKPFLLHLKSNFTQYELIYTLHFKSKYSIRLYELVKSVHYHETGNYEKRYGVDELKKLLDAEVYKEYRDFKRRALEKAVQEINTYSDKNVSYLELKKGKKVLAIIFEISSKDPTEKMRIMGEIQKEMGADQLTLWEELERRGEDISAYQPALPAPPLQ